MAMVFGGSIRFSTAALRSGEDPKSSSYLAHLRNRGKVEQRTTSLTVSMVLQLDGPTQGGSEWAHTKGRCWNGRLSDCLGGQAIALEGPSFPVLNGQKDSVCKPPS
jgi:hypothetical protein